MSNVLTIPKKIPGAIRGLIAQAMQDVLSDPDFKLELTALAKKRLLKEQTDKSKRVSFAEIKKRHYK